jgi:hypothetical protein
MTYGSIFAARNSITAILIRWGIYKSPLKHSHQPKVSNQIAIRRNIATIK